MSNKTQKHSGDMGRWAIGSDAIGDYMRRWFFWCPWFGIRVHHILRSDAGTDFHDHPWDFASLLLTRGYTEILPTKMVAGRLLQRVVKWPRWSIVRHRAEDFHRLVLDAPAWTLVITGPKRKSWGFMLPDMSVIPWREYLKNGGRHG